MARILFALWLAVFSAQAADLGAMVVPDDCIDAGSSTHDDACPDGTCVRCVCCARAVAPVTPVIAVTNSPVSVVVDPPSSDRFVPSPDPRGILHIPKTLA